MFHNFWRSLARVRSRKRDEDFAPATSHTQSLLAEHFFVASVAQLLDIVEQPLPLACALSCSAFSSVALVTGSVLYPFLACIRPSRAATSAPCCGTGCVCRCFPPILVMDIHGDHAFLCRGDAASAGFQLRHRLVQQSLGSIMR